MTSPKNTKHSIFCITCVFITLIISSFSYAKNADETRAIALANATILTFATMASENTNNQIKMNALIANTSEEEARKILEEDQNDKISKLDQMMASMKDQASEEDLKKMKSAFQNHIEMMSSAYASCKVSGPVQTKESQFIIPLKCMLPDSNSLGEIKEPEKSNNQIQDFVDYSQKLAIQFKSSPKVPFDTQIILHRQGIVFFPELDDQNAFPTSVTNFWTGTTEKELMK